MTSDKHVKRNLAGWTVGLVAGWMLVGSASAQDHDNIPYLPTTPRTFSTIPVNGDVNPYGVAFVPKGFATGGLLAKGDILVSNFNNNQNLQGTGSTILRMTATGSTALFFQGPPRGVGLSTALVVLRSGFVIVGNLPTADGTAATAQAGSLLLIDKNGHLVKQIVDPTFVRGPWDATLWDGGTHAKLFVSNVLSGTVVRFDLAISGNTIDVQSTTQIGSGYTHRGDPAALEIGPTGLVYDAGKDVLYVASTGDNSVFALGNAGAGTRDQGTGRLIYQDPTHLHGPLGMAMAPNGHLLVANSDVINVDPNQPSEIVEFTVNGAFVKQLSVDPMLGGSFGLAVAKTGENLSQFAAVDDNTSTLTLWNIASED